MERRTVEIRHEAQLGTWRIYWGGTNALADMRRFETIEEAGPVAHALMEQLETPRPRVADAAH